MNVCESLMFTTAVVLTIWILNDIYKEINDLNLKVCAEEINQESRAIMKELTRKKFMQENSINDKINTEKNFFH